MIIGSGSEALSEAELFLRTGIGVKQLRGAMTASSPAGYAKWQWRQEGETPELVIGFHDHSELVVQLSDLRTTDPIVTPAAPSETELLLRMLEQLTVLSNSIDKAVRRIASEEERPTTSTE